MMDGGVPKFNRSAPRRAGFRRIWQGIPIGTVKAPNQRFQAQFETSAKQQRVPGGRLARPLVLNSGTR